VNAGKGQPVAVASSSTKGGSLVSGLSGGMLAALGAMPPLGGVPSRSSGGMATKRSQGDDKNSNGMFTDVYVCICVSVCVCILKYIYIIYIYYIMYIGSGSATKDGGAGADGTGGGLGAKVPRDPSKLCKCKKSKCVRQYCVCFRAGLLCEGCDCAECLNDGKHESERLAAIEHIKTSDPLAFVDKIRPEQETQMFVDDKFVDDKPDAKKHHVRGCRYDNDVTYTHTHTP
jgi:hypothetical protein